VGKDDGDIKTCCSLSSLTFHCKGQIESVVDAMSWERGVVVRCYVAGAPAEFHVLDLGTRPGLWVVGCGCRSNWLRDPFPTSLVILLTSVGQREELRGIAFGMNLALVRRIS